MSETILCVCGRLWRVQRHALPMPCKDSAICLCGQTLKEWNEPADYLFEPTGVSFVPSELPGAERLDGPATAAQAIRGR